MTRTALLLEIDSEHLAYFRRKITCEVTGEMSDGTKVWTEILTGNQYFCHRYHGVYYFSRF